MGAAIGAGLPQAMPGGRRAAAAAARGGRGGRKMAAERRRRASLAGPPASVFGVPRPGVAPGARRARCRRRPLGRRRRAPSGPSPGLPRGFQGLRAGLYRLLYVSLLIAFYSISPSCCTCSTYPLRLFNLSNSFDLSFQFICSPLTVKRSLGTLGAKEWDWLLFSFFLRGCPVFCAPRPPAGESLPLF